MTKEYHRTELDKHANNVDDRHHVVWCEFLLWRDGFNLHMPIDVRSTSIGVEVSQPDVMALRTNQRTGVSFSDFALKRGALLAEREIAEQMEVQW